MYSEIRPSIDPFKLCLPIIAGSLADAHRIIAAAAERYSFFEIWLDYLRGETAADISAFAKLCPERLLFHFRRERLAPIQMPMTKRLEILSALGQSEVRVDLDLVTQAEEIERFHGINQSARLILSYHNFELTPALEDLLELADSMQARGAQCLKVATFCEDSEAAMRLLQLTQTLMAHGVPRIIAGMGQAGRIVRVTSALWGNELNFAPDDNGHNTAPGQLTYSELSQVLKVIGKV